MNISYMHAKDSSYENYSKIVVAASRLTLYLGSVVNQLKQT